jgi:outer membrane receptor protein involved in Fe transport
MYAYWTPADRWTLRAGVAYERFDQDGDQVPVGPSRMKTWLLPVGVAYFHPSGPFGEVGTTLVYQDIDDAAYSGGDVGHDTFVSVDAAIGYRLPKRYGILSLEVRNLLDEGFHFQDPNFRTGPETVNPRFIPERMIVGRITFSF